MLSLTKRFFLVLSLFFTLALPVFATKGGINVGPYYDQISDAAGVIGANGWVYVLGCPGDVKRMAREYTGNPDYNLMIRAFYRGSDFATAEQARQNARDWANAFAAAPFPKVVYFMPMNEFNNPVEGFFSSSGSLSNAARFDNFLVYLQELQTQFSALSIRGTRVVLLSPSVDPFFLSDHPAQASYMREIPWSSFDGTAVSMYGQYSGDSLDSAAAAVKKGNFSALSEFGVGVSGDIYIVEAGVIKTSDGKVLYKENSSLIVNYFTNQTPSWRDDKVKSVIIFSYNPDPGGNRGAWIYGESGVIDALNNFGGGINTRNSSAPNASIDLNAITGTCGALESETIDVNFNKHQNKIYNLDIRTAISLALKNGNLSIGSLTPNGEYKNTDVSKYADAYDRTLVPMLPGRFKKVEREDPEYTACPEGKTCLKYDRNDKTVQTQFNLCLSTNDKVVVNPDDQQLLSNTNITNSSNIDAHNKARNATWIFGSLFSTNKINNHDNSIPNENLIPAQKLDCNTEETGVDNLPEDPDIQSGNIQFINSQGTFIQDIAVGAAAGIIETIARISTTGSDEDVREYLENNLQIPTRFVSTTNEPANDKKSANIKVTAAGNLPGKINQLIENQPPNAEFDVNYEFSGNQVAIETVEINGNRNLSYMKQHICSTLPRSTNIYTETCGGSSLQPNTTSSNMYALPKESTECSLTESTIDKLSKRLGSGGDGFVGSFYGASEGVAGEANLRNYWGFIQDTAVKYNLNPILAFTFFLEESGAGGFSDATLLGCKYERGTGRPSPVGFSAQTVDQQMRCLSEYIRDLPELDSLMCVYAGEKQTDGSYNCNRVFVRNPNFPGMMRFWRDEIIRFTPNLPESCKVTELDNYPTATFQ